MGRLFTCLLIFACCFSFAALPTEAAFPTKQITGDQIAQTARNYLKQNIPLEDYNLQLKTKLAAQTVPAGKIDLKVKPLNPDKWGGHTAVPVQILLNGKNYRTIVVTFHLQVFQKAVIVIQPLKKGEVISPDKVALKRVDVSRLYRSSYNSLNEVIGARATRYLGPNMILTKADVEQVPLALKGKPVTIRVKVGLVEISTIGKALADGRMGDLIQVQNLDSGKKIFTKVIGPALVEIPNKN